MFSKVARTAVANGAVRDGGRSGAANGSHHSVLEIVEHREESTDSVGHRYWRGASFRGLLAKGRQPRSPI